MQFADPQFSGYYASKFLRYSVEHPKELKICPREEGGLDKFKFLVVKHALGTKKVKVNYKQPSGRIIKIVKDTFKVSEVESQRIIALGNGEISNYHLNKTWKKIVNNKLNDRYSSLSDILEMFKPKKYCRVELDGYEPPIKRIKLNAPNHAQQSSLVVGDSHVQIDATSIPTHPEVELYSHRPNSNFEADGSIPRTISDAPPKEPWEDYLDLELYLSDDSQTEGVSLKADETYISSSPNSPSPQDSASPKDEALDGYLPNSLSPHGPACPVETDLGHKPIDSNLLQIKGDDRFVGAEVRFLVVKYLKKSFTEMWSKSSNQKNLNPKKLKQLVFIEICNILKEKPKTVKAIIASKDAERVKNYHFNKDWEGFINSVLQREGKYFGAVKMHIKSLQDGCQVEKDQTVATT